MESSDFVIHKLGTLHKAVDSANKELTPHSYTQIRAAFLACEADPDREKLLRQVSPEYASGEFLACVDLSGTPIHTSADTLNDYAQLSDLYPRFREWFALETDAQSGHSVLLPARWLCHLTGIRHGTAQLVLAVPGDIPHLLVQVRSMAKSASPGCYDLPVAGHVDGLQSYPDTLRKESREELDLDIDQLVGLRSLGGYVEVCDEPERLFFNTEYHQAYTGSLSRTQVALLNPLPSEVAAIALFPQWELDSLRSAYPAVFAPSILQTLDRYQGQF